MNSTPNRLAVDDPAIAEVMDAVTGDIVPAASAIGTDFAKTEELRMQLAEARVRGEPIYVCPMCGVPVYLVSMREKGRFYFRHDLEDGRCPAQTRGELSADEINARKYNGAKESLAHRRMKQIVAESLRCDPRFSDVKVEKVWHGQDRKAWRKPDVQAIFNGIPVAFEVQLSTTFLHVIAERRVFYLKEGGLLCWIFKTYDEDKSRLTQDDIFYNNNRNLFLASENTLTASLAAGRFTLDCRWVEPRVTNGHIETQWNDRYVGFDELTIDQARQRVFLFDYDTAVTELNQALEGDALRQAFEAFWLPRESTGPYDEHEWAHLRTAFRARGLALPPYPNSGLAPLLFALYSAREGTPVGWKFHNLVSVAHRVVGGHPQYLRLFRRALAQYGRGDQMRAEDKSGKWAAAVQEYLPLLQNNNPRYAHNQAYDDLVRFLFPELRETLQSLDRV